MSKVRVHALARELGMTSAELVELAQTLGYSVQTHANTIDSTEAAELRTVMQGLRAASAFQKARREDDSAQSHSPLQEEEHNTLLLVNMGKQDIRLSLEYDRGFSNMVKVIAALLADPGRGVRTDESTVPWGDLYFLRADRSTPALGYIELEYGDESHGFSQRQKGILGDLLWSANWLNEDWRRPFEKLGQVIGILRDPEGDFRNQLEAELRALEARGRVEGLEEWEISTGIPGRNIYLIPKPEHRPIPSC
jgi:hypothetical protein